MFDKAEFVDPCDLVDPDDEAQMTELALFSGTVPACCSHGCEVEPDGECCHGFLSVLRELGIL